MLSAVSLPGGIQRRRTAEDELQMREILKEGDLVSVRVLSNDDDGCGCDSASVCSCRLKCRQFTRMVLCCSIQEVHDMAY